MKRICAKYNFSSRSTHVLLIPSILCYYAGFGSVSLPLSARKTPEECVPRSLLKSRHRRRNEKKTGRRRQAVTCLPVITARSQEERTLHVLGFCQCSVNQFSQVQRLNRPPYEPLSDCSISFVLEQ